MTTEQFLLGSSELCTRACWGVQHRLTTARENSLIYEERTEIVVTILSNLNTDWHSRVTWELSFCNVSVIAVPSSLVIIGYIFLRKCSKKTKCALFPPGTGSRHLRDHCRGVNAERLILQQPKMRMLVVGIRMWGSSPEISNKAQTERRHRWSTK